MLADHFPAFVDRAFGFLAPISPAFGQTATILSTDTWVRIAGSVSRVSTPSAQPTTFPLNLSVPPQ